MNVTNHKIRKAVIPAAGYGTRFLPATKASPKEMLPIVDKPVIQYIVEEAVASGIEEIIIITGANKRAIEDHFDYNFELEEVLKRGNKFDEYNEIRAISDQARFVYIRQKEQLGNGHAVLQAKQIIGDEPFVVLWGDEIYPAAPPRLKQLIDAYAKYQGTMLSVYKSHDAEAASKYAIASGERLTKTITEVTKIVEKPGPVAQPPYLVSIGGYIFPPSIFAVLENLTPGKGGEIWLIDAIQTLIDNKDVYALEIQNGRHYDCGNKLDYLKANVDIALTRRDVGSGLYQHLQKVVKDFHVK